MQAIRVKYLSPTNSRGARLKATAATGSITIDYPHELSRDECGLAAAEQLREHFNWPESLYGKLVGGELADGSEVFVFVKDDGIPVPRAGLPKRVFTLDTRELLAVTDVVALYRNGRIKIVDETGKTRIVQADVGLGEYAEVRPNA